ncbi:MAG: universal stress protein [Kofleriaceae bacterium]
MPGRQWSDRGDHDRTTSQATGHDDMRAGGRRQGPPRTVASAVGVGAELVVVATRGRTGLRRILLGSVAETVVRRVQCSVLVVRHD